MGKIEEKLREQDMFGHTINLNFNKDGDTHNTAIGGSFSTLIRIVMTLYVFMNFKKMLLHEDDANIVEMNTLDLEEYGVKAYNETDMFIYYVLRKQLSSKLFLGEETARHVDIFFTSVKKDYYTGISDIVEVPAKQCTKEDFLKGASENPQAAEYFDTWEGYSLICPDYDEFELLGNTASMIQSYFTFEIKKCDPAKQALKGLDCATDTEIDDFYYDIQVDTWALQEKMNFLEYGGKTKKPVFLMNDLYMTNVLNAQNTAFNLFYLRLNVINTKDEFFYIG